MKSISNQYRDLKEGKMSQQNFMRNLRMTMPQYVTNVTSFGDAVRILKNKSIIVESAIKENFDFNKAAIESATGDKISHTEEDDFGETIYWSTKNPYVNYYIGSDEQIIKYDGKTGERYPVGDLRNYDEPNDYEPDTDADYEEPRDDFDMAGDYNDGEFWEGKGEGDEKEIDAMIKKMEDEKVGEEEVKSQYDLGEELNEAKKKEEKVEYSKHQCNPTELRLGIRTELEHGDIELDKAKEIAYKNIIKDPIYYTKLKLSGVEAHPKKVKGEKEAPAKKKKETIQLVDLVNQMQKVKMPKADDKKKLKEARFNVIGEPNEVAKQVMQFVDGNDTLKALSDDIQIQQTSDPNEALLRFQYWDALPGEAIEKLKLQFNVQPDNDFDEDTGEIIFYRLTPLRRNYGSKDLGASFEKFKSSLEEIIREVVDETFDGRDNLINPLSAEDENN
jgi:hypothetical protein